MQYMKYTVQGCDRKDNITRAHDCARYSTAASPSLQLLFMSIPVSFSPYLPLCTTSSFSPTVSGIEKH